MRLIRTLVVAALCLIVTDAAAQTKKTPANRAEIQLSFAPLVKKVAPAVVNIYTTRIVRSRSRTHLFDDPFFRRFFGEEFGLGLDSPKRKQQNSLGSGVIVDPNGLIVTNRHVIEGADKIRVVLHDRREFDAEAIATDDKTDLAILRVQADGNRLPYAEIADSDALEVGDLVLAIGNPFGVGQTVTSGIVSALARTGVGLSDLGAFIQTDAAINPGNSGGALVAMDGRLVGINTAIFSKSGGSHGIGFAIPSNMVNAVVRGIVQTGKLVRPWLGAAGQAVTQDIANSFGLERPVGVLINAVHRGGAAAKAGIKVGEVILAVNGYEVNDPNALAHRIAVLPVGDVVVLKVWRNNATRAVKLELAAAPETPTRNETVLSGKQPLAGALVANLSPALAEEIGADPFVAGIIIVDIRHGTPAERLRFRSGDLITAVNEMDVASVRELVAVLERPANRWQVSIIRDGTPRNLVINR